MAETPRIPASPLDPARAAETLRSTPKPTPKGGPRSTSPAFEALLERLTSSAAELEEKTKALASPAELPGAVDAARTSLEDAVSLGEKLLEAYRAALASRAEQPGDGGVKDVRP